MSCLPPEIYCKIIAFSTLHSATTFARTSKTSADYVRTTIYCDIYITPRAALYFFGQFKTPRLGRSARGAPDACHEGMAFQAALSSMTALFRLHILLPRGHIGPPAVLSRAIAWIRVRLPCPATISTPFFGLKPSLRAIALHGYFGAHRYPNGPDFLPNLYALAALEPVDVPTLLDERPVVVVRFGVRRR
ncbi:hypothetical protein B0H11DRAFT_2262084 [Mycena galericulata]|nr:hypothetical protein B0H11DRAFT_2262084 [Mycena galericulata]